MKCWACVVAAEARQLVSFDKHEEVLVKSSGEQTIALSQVLLISN